MLQLMRCETEKRELNMSISKVQQVAVPDLVGLPSLHIATVHGLWATVASLVERFPELVNIQDNVSLVFTNYRQRVWRFMPRHSRYLVSIRSIKYFLF